MISNLKKNQSFSINETKYQNDKYLNEVGTCGRHVMMRIQYHLMGYDSVNYKNYIDNQCKLLKLPSDVIATLMVKI